MEKEPLPWTANALVEQERHHSLSPRAPTRENPQEASPPLSLPQQSGGRPQPRAMSAPKPTQPRASPEGRQRERNLISPGSSRGAAARDATNQTRNPNQPRGSAAAARQVRLVAGAREMS